VPLKIFDQTLLLLLLLVLLLLELAYLFRSFIKLSPPPLLLPNSRSSALL